MKAIAEAANAQAGDLILVLAGAEERTRKAMSELRLEMGKRLGLRKDNEFRLLWVLDFPLFEYDEEGNRWVARHHPFTSPKPSDIEVMINNNPVITDAAKYLEHPYAGIKANAYDMVLNGNEIGGGSIRIYQRALQEKMFTALGMSKEEALHKFGFCWVRLNMARHHMADSHLVSTVCVPYWVAVKVSAILSPSLKQQRPRCNAGCPILYR